MTTYIPAEFAAYITIGISAISLTAGFLLGRRCRTCANMKLLKRNAITMIGDRFRVETKVPAAAGKRP